MIAGTNTSQFPTLEKLQKAEEKYRSLYGDNEPEEWSSNLLKILSEQNIYRAKAYRE